MRASSTKYRCIYASLIVVSNIGVVMGLSHVILFTIGEKHSLITLILRDAMIIMIAFFIVHFWMRQSVCASNDEVQERYRTEKNVAASFNHAQLRKVERELAKRERQLFNILESITEGFCTIDQEQRFTYINKQGAKWLNRNRDEIIGKNVKDVIPELVGRAYAPYYRRVLKERQPVRFETLMYQRWMEVRIYPTPEGLSVYFDDVTEAKKTEEILRKTDKLAVVGQLAAGVAHEIRNPLTSIRGFLQLLLNKNDPEIEKYVEVMLTELDRIELIISEFLVLAKPQAVHIHKHSVEAIMHQAIELLENQMEAHRITYELYVESKIPFIDCEQNQLKQAFLNILKNSIEAMPSGGQLSIELLKDDRGGEKQVLVRIKDEGIGIPKEVLNRLGEPFMSTKDRGTGLGLTVSYKIIQNHQGRITVSSEVGKGTTFEIFLPVRIGKSKKLTD